MPAEVSNNTPDPYMISRRLPRAVAAGDAATVCELALQAGQDMQAERMAALLCDTLDDAQKRDIAAGICADAPVAALAQLGALAFSFPLWRFISQRTQTMDSIIEAIGYGRMTRESDLRDATLPDPARDELGVGFIRPRGGAYVEYRRSYILYASQHGALLVRNSSYFYGRDRLRHAVYIAAPIVPQDILQNLTAAQIDAGDLFKPLANGHGAQVASLVAGFMRHENALHDWVWGEGQGVTLDYLREKLQARRGMPYIGCVKKGWPAWKPRHVVALDEGVIADIAQGIYAPQEGERIVMFSGTSGDFPL